MKFSFTGVNVEESRHTSLADLLVNIEADFEVADDAGVVYAEAMFPVAELARDLTMWKSSGGEPDDDFVFDSMSFDEAGAITVYRDTGGWSVRSVFDPERSTGPLPWADLAEVIDDFNREVSAGIRSIGIDSRSIFDTAPSLNR
ncbi:hypothetical protein [Actinoplanes sp. NBRC 101535]|uniref:DUF7878 domain-containing protein n=1 Tax=Actinoplanes sp. NBRC 101535 TaxID=3032196 RepID=UPI0024A28EF5|nr:hypothetical protein [Actinoplanes sp. NBRC 101535]GLY00666.1 hypothetical protein Acsp01_10450 [Actinoplanes sp. NBRC 101535]